MWQSSWDSACNVQACCWFLWQNLHHRQQHSVFLYKREHPVGAGKLAMLNKTYKCPENIVRPGPLSHNFTATHCVGWVHQATVWQLPSSPLTFCAVLEYSHVFVGQRLRQRHHLLLIGRLGSIQHWCACGWRHHNRSLVWSP